MEKKLVNKKAIITGGSRGIGKAIAKALLEQGADVWLAARDARELEATVKELSPLGSARFTVFDVTDEKAVHTFAGDVRKAWGGVDVVVNGAGVYGPIGAVHDVRPDEWLAALKVNLFGTFLAIHEFVPLMKGRARGVIINFVGGGEGAYPHFSSYVSAKGGIARFTETVAEELRELRIDVNAIAPGAVNTKFLDDLLAAGPAKAGAKNYERAKKQKDLGGTPPEKAAALAVWLASEKSAGLTGKIISAVWDDYEKFPAHMKDIASTELYTMRRVRPEDRGFEWDKR